MKEPGARVTRGRAFGRGVVASVLVAVLLDQGGALTAGALGALAVIAIVVALAPPRALDLLRAELRAPPVPGAFGSRGVPIGPALTYACTVLSTPFLIWIAMIVVRALAGITIGDVPPSAFAVATAVWVVLLVEGLRARRPTAV